MDNQITCESCSNVKELSYNNYIAVTVSYCINCERITRHFKDITMLKKSEYICQCTKCGKKSVCLKSVLTSVDNTFIKYCQQCGEPLEHTFVPKVVTK